MVLHSTMAARPVNVAFFFSMSNLTPIFIKSRFITLFDSFWPLFSFALNTKGVMKSADLDY
ncbi:hypothetical protein EOL18_04745 [Raoultella ornithinolytica]|nr:hypothetical protein EOL18_04745 [Raoultella ornithinolytica]